MWQVLRGGLHVCMCVYLHANVQACVCATARVSATVLMWQLWKQEQIGAAWGLRGLLEGQH